MGKKLPEVVNLHSGEVGCEPGSHVLCSVANILTVGPFFSLRVGPLGSCLRRLDRKRYAVMRSTLGIVHRRADWGYFYPPKRTIIFENRNTIYTVISN